MALIKTGDAFELFRDILRYRGEDLGDWLTEDVPGLFAVFGEDFIERLIEFTDDETLDSFVRGMAVTGLAVLARKYPVHEDHVKEHLIKLLNDTYDETFASIITRPKHTKDPLEHFSRKNIGHLHSIHHGEPEEHDTGLMNRNYVTRSYTINCPSCYKAIFKGIERR